MNKKRWMSLILIVAFLLITSLHLYMIYTFKWNHFQVTGRPIDSGIISLEISASAVDFLIVSPLNQSYAFNLSDRIDLMASIPTFLVALNVTTEDAITVWRYNLSKNGVLYETSQVFSPNTTIAARSGLNTLYVYASDGSSSRIKNVTFYVNVSSSAPILNVTEDYQFFACEGESFVASFNITDYDNLSSALSVSLSPQVPPFYPGGITQIGNYIFASTIHSFGIPLSSAYVGTHNKTIIVVDTGGTISYSDSKNVSIIVLDVNKIPVVENLGVYQIAQTGNGTQFYKAWSVEDLFEDGVSLDGNMIFSLTYQNGTSFTLFSINNYGIMNFTSDENVSDGTYNLKACVTDTPVVSPHPNLTDYCVLNGSSHTVCDNFFLTISSDNRAPEIIATYPTTSFFNASGTVTLPFNITFVDEDIQPLSVDWYVNGVVMNQTTFSFDSDYTYVATYGYGFPCGVSGNQTIMVNVSDGLLYDNFTWTIDVTPVACSIPSSSGGGGGGGGGGGSTSPFCYEKWVCSDWQECFNARTAFTDGEIYLDLFNNFVDQCRQLGYSDSSCGYQTRRCTDIAFCNNTNPLVALNQSTRQVCEYVADPRCSDGVKNCHNGACEVLVDCGGPCSPCPTCNDGIQNQNEQGIDCGGPCSLPCDYEAPLPKINRFLVLIILQILLVVIFIIYLLYRLWLAYYGKDRDDDDDQKEKQDTSSTLRGKTRAERIRRLLKQ